MLWICKPPIPHDENLGKTLENTRFDGTDSSIQPLRPLTSEISEHLKASLPRGTIHILVELPGECSVSFLANEV
jgi:hypothetical protein